MKHVELFEGYLTEEEANAFFNSLINSIGWHDTLFTEDNTPVKIKRKMAYVFDEVVDYKYANLKFVGELWNETLTTIRDKVRESTGIEFNSVLLNLYNNGKDEIKWHSDKEDSLGDIKESVIATINLGATRKFWFLEKESGEKSFHYVKNGDLLMMNAGCQDKFLHAILPEKEIKEPRISLTFRKVNHG